VLSTLHTNSAPQTITRIVDVFPPEQQSLDQHLKSLVKLRRIPPEEAAERAVDKDSFRLESAAGRPAGGDGGSAVRPPATSRPLSG
jgi:Tfp pilus assembly pilus retraction ATPase PilT